MINEDKRRTINVLYKEGKKKKEIARLLGCDPKTVRRIIVEEGGSSCAKQTPIKKAIEREQLETLYQRCEGYVQRVQEVLKDEYQTDIGYSTLTRLIRSHGIGQQVTQRCQHVEDVPGEEMQHDTSPYKLKIGERIVPVVCSGLYLRYSKMRYVKFYRHFNRFKMKCFFHEALSHWGYAAKTCIIDNTNLAILRGTGREALIHPAMVSFCKPYGFGWRAHAKGHSNRKAGKERNFWTLETNFFPGRTFDTFEDLNQKAFHWATQHYAHRPQDRTRLIPLRLFEHEKSQLIPMPSFVEPPYQPHQRETDRYGYIAFQANYYLVPGKSRDSVNLLEYSDRIKLLPNQGRPVEYPLPPQGTRGKKYSPPGCPGSPYEPRSITKPCHEEEKHLRQYGKICCDYLDFIKSAQSPVPQKPKFIRALYSLSKKMSLPLFQATLERALAYRVAHQESLMRIGATLLKKDLPGSDLPPFEADNDYENRDTYQAGRFSQESPWPFLHQRQEEDPPPTPQEQA